MRANCGVWVVSKKEMGPRRMYEFEKGRLQHCNGRLVSLAIGLEAFSVAQYHTTTVTEACFAAYLPTVSTTNVARRVRLRLCTCQTGKSCIFLNFRKPYNPGRGRYHIVFGLPLPLG